jgi:hypothetical protein
MLNKNIPNYSGAAFTWMKNSGAANASDLMCSADCGSAHKLILTDSLDVGFTISSHHTGTKKLFIYDCTELDTDGEAVCNIYVSHVNNNGFPGHDICVRIYND